MRTLGFRAFALSAMLGALGLTQSASATPVTMNYCVQDAGGGLFEYTFTLTLDNNDGTWSPGFGLGWIVFADVPAGLSPLNDFVGDPSSLPIGPWTEYTTSGGGHNGPTLGPVVVQTPPYPILYWVPNAVGDSLTWRGTSATLVTPGQMQWSALFAEGDGVSVNFVNMANVCGPVGACCSSTGCSILPQDVCTAAGGTYNGDGSTCDSCPATGACCGSSGCSILTSAACATAGGHWQGAGSVCPTSGYSVSNDTAAFVDISGTGTDVTSQLSNCDDGGTTISIPFDFSFYGNTFNSVWFCTNGFLQFGGANRVDYNNGTPPSAGDPGNAIYPLWDDLYLCNVGNMYYEVDGTTPNQTLTLSWQGVAKFSDQSNGSQNFQAVLHETTSNIELRYGSITPDAGGGGGPNGSDYTIGVENSTGTVATVINGADIGSGNTARMFTFAPATCGPVCGSADFNCDGDVGTDQDIESFFACLAGDCPAAPCTSSADFNGDGDVGTDQDIEAFFRVLAGGNC